MDAELAGAASSQSANSSSISGSLTETETEAVLQPLPQVAYPPAVESPIPPSDDLNPIPSPLPHAPPSPPRSPVSWRSPPAAAAAAGPASTSSVSSSSPPPATSSSTSTATSASFSSSHATSSSVASAAATAGGEEPTEFEPGSKESSKDASPIPPASPSLAAGGASATQTPQARSPSSSSVFLSASNSPFCSPSSAAPSSNPFLTPPSASYVTASNTPSKLTPASSQRYNSGHASTSYEHGRSEIIPEITPVEVPPPARRAPAAAAAAPAHVPAAPVLSKSPQRTTTTFRPSPRHALALSNFHPSPSPSARPRTCDVFISVYGSDPALLRFSKWMRAELELQGVACFSADRSLYSEQRSHDIALRIINSATFGVVIISRKLFRNPYSIQEIRTFLERKNLVPVFFDLTPVDCVASDIVERRGRVWEHEGGELWKLYDGQEREWKEVVEALVRIEDWRLEAFNGNWRECIQRAVGLVGSRLGRRSVADRERVRWERIDLEEFPFPRNANFVGRERELKALESLLFQSSSFTSSTSGEGLMERSSDRGSRDSSTFGDVQLLRRSNAEMAQVTFPETSGATATATADTTARESNFKEGEFLNEIASSWQSPDTREVVESSMREGGERETDIMYRRHYHLQQDAQRGRILHRGKRRESKEFTRGSELEGAQQNVVCVTGVAGIGKTDLALEYAYINVQKYRMVLWVGGEARYIRQNYHNLSLFLGVDVSTESHFGPERGRAHTFEEQEADALQKVKRELQRDVPYLIIIDNLEMERDWWDGHEISDLLPRPGSASHVIITTRLARVLDMEPLVLSCLSGAEALTLMKGGRDQHFPVREYDKLKELEDRLARLTLGLSIIGKVLIEFQMRPTELLEQMNRVILKETPIGDREDAILRENPYLVRLLDVCFALLGGAEGEKNLATRMTWVGGWFAPYAIPYSLLAIAASKLREDSGGRKFRGKGVTKMFLCCVAPNSRRMEAEAGAHLIKCNIARRSMQEGCIRFHDIVQIYARKRGGELAARAAVQAVRKGGNLTLHYDHFWAACYLVFQFGNDPVLVDLRVMDLLLFTKKVVLPLTLRVFTNFSRCNAAVELLRQCNSMFEEVEKSFVSQIQDWWDKSLCWMRGGYEGQQVDEYAWQDLTLLKAVLLETQAKLMMKGGQFDTGEEACRTCLNIRTVMLGPDHADTIAAQETLAKLVRYRNTM